MECQPVVFSVSSRLGDTLAEALVHQNKNDSCGGLMLSLSLSLFFAVSITRQVWNFNEGEQRINGEALRHLRSPSPFIVKEYQSARQSIKTGND